MGFGMGLDKIINYIPLFTGVTVTNGTSVVSGKIASHLFAFQNLFSVFIKHHGQFMFGVGRGDLTYEISYDGDTFLTPTSASSIVTSYSASSGVGQGGQDFVSFSPVLAPWLRLRWHNISNTAASPIGVTTWIAVG